MRYLKLFAVFFKTSVQTDMEYRADFFTRILASVLGLLTTLGSLSVAYSYTPTIRGWSFAQVTTLLAVYYLVDGIIEMFIAPNMRQIMAQVRDGTLDFVILKPVSTQFMATFRTVNVWRIVNVIVALGLAAYAIGKLSLTVGWLQALTFALTLTAGIAIIYSFWLFLVTLTFWVVRIDNIEQLIWQAFEAGRYPIEIYPTWLRMTLTYFVPVAFIITVPAQALTGRGDLSLSFMALGIGSVTILLASAFWRFGLKRYTGASA
jgi:ABC-2 type transport system permease protein